MNVFEKNINPFKIVGFIGVIIMGIGIIYFAIFDINQVKNLDDVLSRLFYISITWGLLSVSICLYFCVYAVIKVIKVSDAYPGRRDALVELSNRFYGALAMPLTVNIIIIAVIEFNRG